MSQHLQPQSEEGKLVLITNSEREYYTKINGTTMVETRQYHCGRIGFMHPRITSLYRCLIGKQLAPEPKIFVDLRFQENLDPVIIQRKRVSPYAPFVGLFRPDEYIVFLTRNVDEMVQIAREQLNGTTDYTLLRDEMRATINLFDMLNLNILFSQLPDFPVDIGKIPSKSLDDIAKNT